MTGAVLVRNRPVIVEKKLRGRITNPDPCASENYQQAKEEVFHGSLICSSGVGACRHTAGCDWNDREVSF